MTIGVDEVGRGPLAGPLVVCAVRFPSNINVEGLTDSKNISSKNRELIYEKLINLVDYSLGWVSADEIDDYGLSISLKLAASKALEGLLPNNEKLIVDGNVSLFPLYVNEKTMIKADSKVLEVSAASIIAKVIRDKRMIELSKKYPNYDLESNMGYGSKNHIEHIKKLGYSPIHRRSFVIKYLIMDDIPTVATGNLAESFVADKLESIGYLIIDRNWRNKWCEIDIIAKKDNEIYFIEVRFRKNDNWGTGIETITSKKYKQMMFAAELWLSSNNSNQNANLAVASVHGNPIEFDDFIVL